MESLKCQAKEFRFYIIVHEGSQIFMCFWFLTIYLLMGKTLLTYILKENSP